LRVSKPLFSKSIRKHIRFQKARIRREVLDVAQRAELIAKLRERMAVKKKEPVLLTSVQQKPKKVSVKKSKLAKAAKAK
jgi:hypothetical protein